MESFITDIFGDALSAERRLAVFTVPGLQARLFADAASAMAYAKERSAAEDVYFGVGLIRGRPRGRGKAKDVAAIGALWADIDLVGPGRAQKPLPATVDHARRILDGLPHAPSILVHSGFGLHAYWPLKEPWVFDTDAERTQAARLAKGWHGTVCAAAESLGWHLENLGDLARVLRLPGTLNHKGATPAEVRLLESQPHRRYNPEDFEAYLAEPDGDAPPSAGESLVLRPDAEPPAAKMAEAVATCPKFRDTWNRERPDLADQSQSGYDLALASIAARIGWSDQEIADLLIAARRRHNEKPEKALRADYVRRTIGRGRAAADALPQEGTDVDLSGILGLAGAEESAAPPAADPGPLPDDLLRVPGFVGEVMDFCLQTAPYPNPVMAFCGALSLQAFLAGRKVRDPGDNRTNVYLLGLAHSSAGKDWPRKVNTRILHGVGLAECLGERFASGEGVQDALFLTPSMLFQTDEIDGILQSINKAKDARHEGIMSTLLTLYSASNSVFPMRRKAGKESPGVIDQPCLVIFGTAIPNHYYEALSERMLTNGFFARMVIIEAGQRGSGQEPSIRDVPPRVLETARWWADYQPGERRGNLLDIYPVPTVVEQSDEAQRLLVEVRQEAEVEYAKAEVKNDSVGTTVWGRASEQVRKLALLYAVSQNHLSPRIGQAAVAWASRFVMHQTRRMLFMAFSHVAENPFHAECLKLMQKLRDAPGQEMTHSVLLKRMKIDAKSFRDLVSTLVQRGDVEVRPMTTTGRTGFVYRLLGEGKKGEESERRGAATVNEGEGR